MSGPPRVSVGLITWNPRELAVVLGAEAARRLGLTGPFDVRLNVRVENGQLTALELELLEREAPKP